MKRLLSILLAAAMLIGMTVSSSAKTVTTGIRGINESDFAGQIALNSQNSKIMLNDKTKLSLEELEELEPNPGDIVKIYLTGNLFVDRDKNVMGAYSDNVSKSALTSASVGVRTTSVSSTGMVEVTIDGNKDSSYIKIEFSKNPAYADKKFAFSVFLSYNGVRKAATRIGLRGAIATNEVEVGANSYYVNLSAGAAAKATASVRGVEMYLGEGCSIIRNLIKGKIYRGIATTEILPQDEALFEKYWELNYIYRLQTVGLKATGNIVQFDLDEKYYVYNTNGAYIGTSDKMLPYWTKYYMTSKKYDKIEVQK